MGRRTHVCACATYYSADKEGFSATLEDVKTTGRQPRLSRLSIIKVFYLATVAYAQSSPLFVSQRVDFASWVVFGGPSGRCKCSNSPARPLLSLSLSLSLHLAGVESV